MTPFGANIKDLHKGPAAQHWKDGTISTKATFTERTYESAEGTILILHAKT
jgi:hypothetical protein